MIPVCLSAHTDEFEDEGILEKSMVKTARVKSDAIPAVGETSTVKEPPRKESRKISVTAMDPRKRTREEEEYVPQSVVSVNFSLLVGW